MISVSGKKWEQKKINQNLVDKLKQDFNFSDILSRLIISRKFDDDEITTIDTDLDLNNVFLNNKDFNQSIKLAVNCINNNEKICILGDYDVDGSAATSLFVKFLESINYSFFYYIPDRKKDGYGATKKLFQKLILEKPKLIIMVDCGSTSNEAIELLNENEINFKDFVVSPNNISLSIIKEKQNKFKNLFFKQKENTVNNFISEYNKFELDLEFSQNKVFIKFSNFGLISLNNAALKQTIEIIRRRIDDVGTKEPTILQRGDKRILVELPGLDDPMRIKSLLGKTANLTFRFVTQNNNDTFGAETLKFEDGDDEALVSKRIILIGENLLDAQEQMNNQTNETVV